MRRKTQINPAPLSKINWTAIIGAAINLAIALGLVPGPLRDWYEGLSPSDKIEFLGLLNAVILVLISVFRTWFTVPQDVDPPQP